MAREQNAKNFKEAPKDFRAMSEQVKEAPKKKRRYVRQRKCGKPTTYEPIFCDKIISFFKDMPLTKEVQKISGVTGTPYITIEANEYPTIGDFCKQNNISRSCINSWAKRHQEFEIALKIAKEYQHEFLIKNALIGRYSAGFAAFAMKNIAGWRDHSEVKHSGDISLKGILDDAYGRCKANDRGMAQVSDN